LLLFLLQSFKELYSFPFRVVFKIGLQKYNLFFNVQAFYVKIGKKFSTACLIRLKLTYTDFHFAGYMNYKNIELGAQKYILFIFIRQIQKYFIYRLTSEIMD